MTKTPWNKDKAIGQKKPFTVNQVRMLRQILKENGDYMELALLDLGLELKLHTVDLLELRVADIPFLHQLSGRAWRSVVEWIYHGDCSYYIFPAKLWNKGGKMGVLSRVTYSRIVKKWCRYLDLDPAEYSTSSIKKSPKL